MKTLAAWSKPLLWFALFLGFFSLFLALFWLEASLDKAFFKLQHFAAANNIELTNTELGKWPPSLHIKTVALPCLDTRLLLENLEARLRFFPLSLSISCETLGGEANLLADIGISIPPTIEKLRFFITGAALNKAPEKLRKNVYLEILDGKIKAQGEFELGLRLSHPDWQKIQGKLNIDLDQASIQLLLPILKKDRLENIGGKAALLLKDRNILLEFCKLSSPPLSFMAQGEIRNFLPGFNGQLNIKTELQVPEANINAALVPARTRERILKNGLVRARLAGTLRHPEIYLEN